MAVEKYKPFQSRTPDVDYLIIEMFGGHNNLAAFVYQDLQEAAAGMKGGNIALIGLAAVGDKPGSVVEVTPTHGIQLIEDMGQIDTGDPAMLANFLARALMTYPNAKKAIGFWDHGTGIFDETDSSELILARGSVAREDRSRSYPARHLFFPRDKIADDIDVRSMLHDDTTGGMLTNREAGAMLGHAFKEAGAAGKVELIFSDTCLNGMIEVLDEIGEYANCIVASSDLEPGDGWDYQKWVSKTVAKPPANGAEWGAQAVEAFKECYEPVPRKHPCTLGAFRSDHQITDAFTGLIATARREGGFETFFFLDHARSKSQGFAQRDTYDLRDFAAKVVELTKEAKPSMANAAQGIIEAYDAARISYCALGKMVEYSTGLAFYFPSSVSQMRRDISTYEQLAFSRNSGWADFLKEFR
ncbi:MAG: clostripain-related cysteine peptidase [Hyphomicrobiaceae bacterium]